ncbi:hypothetical protein ABKV19_016327 [Rosa sericea]
MKQPLSDTSTDPPGIEKCSIAVDRGLSSGGPRLKHVKEDSKKAHEWRSPIYQRRRMLLELPVAPRGTRSDD